MYYRVAFQKHSSQTWQWRSTVLSSLSTLFQFLRLYQAFPQAHLRVFSCSSHECLDEMLTRENNGLEANSTTAQQFLRERCLAFQREPQGTPEPKTHVNQGSASIAVATTSSVQESNGEVHILSEWSMNALERRRVELEGGAGGDHDLPYTFTLPTCVPQALAWTRLLVKVRDGELQP